MKPWTPTSAAKWFLDATKRQDARIFVAEEGTKGMGVTSLGSIHNKIAVVCMPVASLPPTLNVESAISASHWPCAEGVDFEPRFKTPWIQAIGANPMLLNEPPLSSRDNPFSAVEEVFEKYSWIPNEYVKLGCECFMEKYCWA